VCQSKGNFCWRLGLESDRFGSIFILKRHQENSPEKLIRNRQILDYKTKDRQTDKSSRKLQKNASQKILKLKLMASTKLEIIFSHFHVPKSVTKKNCLNSYKSHLGGKAFKISHLLLYIS
jgi:hypothetical protein